jgi:hypothetical protein
VVGRCEGACSTTYPLVLLLLLLLLLVLLWLQVVAISRL